MTEPHAAPEPFILGLRLQKATVAEQN